METELNIFQQYPAIWAALITAMGAILLWLLQRWATKPSSRDSEAQYREELRAENQQLRDENRELRDEVEEYRDKVTECSEKILQLQKQLGAR